MSSNPVGRANPIDTIAPLEPEKIRRISDAAFYWAEHTPESEAVVFGDSRTSWSDLAAQVEQCAAALMRQGVGRGERVAYLGTPRPEYLITFLATAHIGAIWLGLNPKYRLEELDYVVGDAEPVLLLGQSEIDGRDLTGDVEELARRTPTVVRTVHLGSGNEALLSGFARFLEEAETEGKAAAAGRAAEVEPLDPCLLVYTSGSTGRPKGALLTHHGLVYCAKVQWERWHTSSPPALVNNFPINHVACTGDLCAYLQVAGGRTVFQESFDPAATLEAVEREGCNGWGGVPTMLHLCVAHPHFRDLDLSSIELVIWSGAAAPRELLEAIRERLPQARLATSFGMTETTGSVTYSDPEDDLDTLAETVGHAEPRYELRIVTEEDEVAQPGTEGELQVRGSYLMAGYLNRPEANADTFTADGWMRTGDLAVEREDGNYRLIGRLSDMFKSGGYNVYPREIELALEEHPAVALAAVVDVPDPLFQEVGHAFVLCDPESETDEESLRDFCRLRLANYKVPKRILLREELPFLPVGKIDKVTLRREARDEIEAEH